MHESALKFYKRKPGESYGRKMSRRGKDLSRVYKNGASSTDESINMPSSTNFKAEVSEGVGNCRPGDKVGHFIEGEQIPSGADSATAIPAYIPQQRAGLAQEVQLIKGKE